MTTFTDNGRQFISAHSEDYVLYDDVLIYSYNQVHSGTECTPMELVLSRAPPNLELEDYNPPTVQARSTRGCWISKLGNILGEYTKRFKRRSSDTSAILSADSAAIEKALNKGDLNSYVWRNLLKRKHIAVINSHLSPMARSVLLS